MAQGDPLSEPLAHRSVSQFTTYADCSEHYRLTKVDRAPKRPAAWLAQGVVVHDCCELWESSGRTVSLDALLDYYDQKWSEFIGKQREEWPDDRDWITGSGKPAETDREQRWAKGRQQVADYVGFALVNADVWRPLELAPDEYAVEVPFEMQFDDVKVIGYIDQVIEWRDGSITVRDIKTGTKLPTSPFQLGTYKLAIEAEYGISVHAGDFYMCKNIAATALIPLHAYSAELVGEWYKRMDRGVKAGVFIPNPSSFCRICEVEPFCSARGMRRDEYPIIAREIGMRND